MATSSLALAAAARYRLQRNPQLAVHRQTIGIEGRSDGGPTLQGPSARRRQGGLPFTSTMVCEPPDNGGSSSQAGETDDMPQAQVQSLVNTLNGEQPTYVLTFSSGFASGSCVAFLTRSHIIQKLAQAQTPGDPSGFSSD